MVNDTLDLDNFINVDQVSSSIWSSIPPQFIEKFSLVITLAKILLLVIIVYFIIILISKLFSLRDSFNLKTIANNTIQTNEKLDKIIELLGTSSKSTKKRVKDKLSKDGIEINHFP